MQYEERLTIFQTAKIQEMSGDMVNAQAGYDRIIDGAVDITEGDEVSKELAYDALYRKIIMNLKKRDLALRLVSQLVHVAHQDKFLEDRSLFDAADMYTRLGEPVPAKELYTRLVSEYPKSTYALGGLFALGKLNHHDLEQPKEAIAWYTSFLNKQKEEGASKRIAASFLSDCYLAIGDIEGAKLTLKTHLGVVLEDTEGR